MTALPIRDQIKFLGISFVVMFVAAAVGGMFEGAMPTFFIAIALELAALRKFFASRFNEFMRRISTEMSATSKVFGTFSFHLSITFFQILLGLAVVVLGPGNMQAHMAAIAGIIVAIGLNGFFVISDLNKSGFYQ